MYGLIGKKLSHSYSKIIHEKLNKNIKYNLYETRSLEDFFNNESVLGVNITIPYKNEVISFCDELDSIAKHTSSVNTLICSKGFTKGYNTDYFGLEFSLKYNNISLNNKVVMIIGNGSTSRTIKYLCEKNDAKKIYIVARNPKSNEYNIIDVNKLKDVEIIFNATPVGMFPDNFANIDINLSLFSNLEFVMDLVYNPLRSKLLLDAEKEGIKGTNGLLMLVAQATKAAELFYNMKYSDKTIEDLYKETLLDSLNLVFIGMPMSGKSFTAREISKVYGKMLIDIDKTIEVNQNNSIENIFKNDGEKRFRTLEFESVDNLYKSHSLAVSCGGGIVLNNENILKLKQNGLVIFIDVPLRVLLNRQPRNRPLITNGNALKLMYDNRYDLYVNSADVIIIKEEYNFNEIQEKIEVSINEYINS